MIPLHHQEKFNGTGYPARLKGEEICIGARIFAVVDTYDTMGGVHHAIEVIHALHLGDQAAIRKISYNSVIVKAKGLVKG